MDYGYNRQRDIRAKTASKRGSRLSLAEEEMDRNTIDFFAKPTKKTRGEKRIPKIHSEILPKKRESPPNDRFLDMEILVGPEEILIDSEIMIENQQAIDAIIDKVGLPKIENQKLACANCGKKDWKPLQETKIKCKNCGYEIDRITRGKSNAT
jgi:DNA-directed RNA polymerase subunit RPC12/RpoP